LSQILYYIVWHYYLVGINSTKKKINQPGIVQLKSVVVNDKSDLVNRLI